MNGHLRFTFNRGLDLSGDNVGSVQQYLWKKNKKHKNLHSVRAGWGQNQVVQSPETQREDTLLGERAHGRKYTGEQIIVITGGRKSKAMTRKKSETLQRKKKQTRNSKQGGNKVKWHHLKSTNLNFILILSENCHPSINNLHFGQSQASSSHVSSLYARLTADCSIISETLIWEWYQSYQPLAAQQIMHFPKCQTIPLVINSTHEEDEEMHENLQPFCSMSFKMEL